MSNIIVGPITASDDIAARLSELGASQKSVSMIRVGSIAKSAVSEWIGVEPPSGDDAISVNLVAPELDGREPSMTWAYTHPDGTWSWESEGARGCFNHTDLVAVKFSA